MTEVDRSVAALCHVSPSLALSSIKYPFDRSSVSPSLNQLSFKLSVQSRLQIRDFLFVKILIRDLVRPFAFAADHLQKFVAVVVRSLPVNPQSAFLQKQ